MPDTNDPPKTCAAERCSNTVYAKGLCLRHYTAKRRGKDVNKHVLQETKRKAGLGDVQLSPARVSPEVAAAIRATCERSGISEYEFVRRLILKWYGDLYVRALPPEPEWDK
jgi:hypothetical protein